MRISSERKFLTVMFCDIVDFTRLSENMTADELTTWLNRYLNTMADVALRYDGTIDKFMGDAVLVFFGDPGTKGRYQRTR